MTIQSLLNFFSRFRHYDEQIRRYFLTNVALGFTIDGVYAVLLNLYLLRLGYDARFIGQVNSIALLCFAAMSLPAGIFGSRWTSSRMLKFGSACVLIGTLLLPLGEFSPPAWRELWYIVTYASILSGFSLYFVNAAPFLMSAVEDGEQNRAFAMQNALMASAAFLGSLLAGSLPELIVNFVGYSLDEPEPYRYTLLCVALIAFMSFVTSLGIKEPKRKKEEAAKSDSPKPSRFGFSAAVVMVIAIMSLVRFLQVAGVGTVSVYYNVYMDTQLEMSPSLIGWVAGLARLLAVPLVLIAPRLVQRSSTARVALWASFATTLGLLPMALLPNAAAASFALVSILSLTSLRFTAFIVYIMTLVPARQQAVMAGAGETAAGFSFALMALSGGYIITGYGYRELFLLGFALSGLGTLIFGLYLRREKAQRMLVIESQGAD
jgi:MFS family permease